MLAPQLLQELADVVTNLRWVRGGELFLQLRDDLTEVLWPSQCSSTCRPVPCSLIAHEDRGREPGRDEHDWFLASARSSTRSGRRTNVHRSTNPMDIDQANEALLAVREDSIDGAAPIVT